jgi:hypothetical protein
VVFDRSHANRLREFWLNIEFQCAVGKKLGHRFFPKFLWRLRERTLRIKGYDASLAKLRRNKFDQECIFSIAGFVAYIAVPHPSEILQLPGSLSEKRSCCRPRYGKRPAISSEKHFRSDFRIAYIKTSKAGEWNFFRWTCET